jgi:cation diffusion facilitator family transporter
MKADFRSESAAKNTTGNGPAVRLALLGLLVNTLFALAKVVAGVIGHSHALVADGIESTTDVFGSLVVWRGLRIAARGADEAYPYGYGKAEPLAAALVSLILLVAAAAIVAQAVHEILTPHKTPAPFTLVVLVLVVLVKETLYRRVARLGRAIGSNVVLADAWHHRSDAITSAAAMIGITVALWGGPGWEAADDWAAIAAAVVIALNGIRLLQPAVAELMDKGVEPEILNRISTAAQGVDAVLAIEKLKVRRSGTRLFVDLHVQADPAMSLHDAHVLSGKVKSAIVREVPAVQSVLVHMEPHEPHKAEAARVSDGDVLPARDETWTR